MQARRAPIDVLTALFERLGQLGTVATGTAPVVLLRHRAVLSAAARYAYEGVDGASLPPARLAFHAVRAHRRTRAGARHECEMCGCGMADGGIAHGHSTWP